ncbi:MAG: phosphoesterase [Geobacteraceae bacterium]|nr:phosphoesterase [Geobacteraceae bacterium]
MVQKDVATLTFDSHCHLLPGIDDGAATMEESLEMARVLVAAGFTTVCCTPHLIKGVYDSTSAEIRILTAELQNAIVQESIPLQLVAGAEYYLDEYLPDFLKDPLLLDESHLLLVEIQNNADIKLVQDTFFRMKSSGLTPLIAHPERCRLLSLPEECDDRKGLMVRLLSPFTARHSQTKEPSLLSYLQSIGCQFQGDIGSFAGLYGDRVRAQANSFLQAGLYTHFGSDAHHSRHLADLLRNGMSPLKNNI